MCFRWEDMLTQTWNLGHVACDCRWGIISILNSKWIEVMGWRILTNQGQCHSVSYLFSFLASDILNKKWGGLLNENNLVFFSRNWHNLSLSQINFLLYYIDLIKSSKSWSNWNLKALFGSKFWPQIHKINIKDLIKSSISWPNWNLKALFGSKFWPQIHKINIKDLIKSSISWSNWNLKALFGRKFWPQIHKINIKDLIKSSISWSNWNLKALFGSKFWPQIHKINIKDSPPPLD